MSKIKIKNFGPIKEGCLDDDGWMDVKKVTVFIGNQGSGKSVVAKLISTFTWIEKALTRGDYDIRHFERKGKFINQYLTYHRIENYFPKSHNTLFDYKGDEFNIRYDNKILSVDKAKNGEYDLPQIMYVPAERNFISNVRTPKALKQISPALSELVTEFINAGNAMKGPMLLPINDKVYIEYNKLNDIFYIGGKDYRIKLTEASSGFQSLVPLHVISWFLSDVVQNQSGSTSPPMTSEQRERFRERFKALNDNPDLTDELRRIALSEIAKEFTKTAFINIVEEPEQNLFPLSQWRMLQSLLEFNNLDWGNNLVITTHSPYLVNYMSIAIQAEFLRQKINGSKNAAVLFKKMEQIISQKSLVPGSEVVIYQLDESKGTIKKLPNPEGIPSDKNYLNQSLRHGNEMFDTLLEIEQEL